MDCILGSSHSIDIAIRDVSPNISVSLKQDVSPSVSVALKQAGFDIPKYKGPYDVTPTVDGLTLATADKHLDKDINVMAIPYFEVSNVFDGETIYIAKEL